MILLYRARLVLVAALVGAIAIVAFEFPFSEILHQRGQLASVSAELSVVSARNASVRADISALSSKSAIAAIAHEEYGLVQPGQHSYVILPAAGSGGSDLNAPVIPPQDFVAAPSVANGPPVVSAAVKTGTSFWSRFASRLDFWRWAF